MDEEAEFSKSAMSLPDQAKRTTDFDVTATRLEEHQRISRHLASVRLHEIKHREGRHGADNVLFDRTGGVFDPETLELLGSLTAGGGDLSTRTRNPPR